jgi:hypothetical protein
MAYLREKNHCFGCRQVEKNKPATRIKCRIRVCKNRKGNFCFECDEFPCERLKHIDKRYHTKYEMSMIENLEFIRDHSIKKFLQREQKRWTKGDKIYCVHKHKYYAQIKP